MSERTIKYYAHTPAKGSEQWHALATHLLNTSRLAASFGRNKNENHMLRLAGLLHDLGKYQIGFQNYLVSAYQGKKLPKLPHAIIGASAAYNLELPEIAFAIAGHHAGIPDISDLRNRFKQLECELPGKEKELLATLIADTKTDIPKFNEAETSDDSYLFDTHIRFLFSCLVDADFLNTEEHFDRGKSISRKSKELHPKLLIEKINQNFAHFTEATAINQLRTSARQECISKSSLKRGLFSLVLPTGLGKTLTSMAWALEHAEKNSLKRIIIVLPYTNIIDQTAKELKTIFGEDWVLEHHSSIEIEEDKEGTYDPKKLASENWDSPIIVTTTVQFFESLFSNRPSKCRKLHSIADAVVIFDEVQTLPKESIKPTLRMIGNIQKVFQTSFVFCTATMPAFQKRPGFATGLEDIIPLINNPVPLFEQTIRVEYSFIQNLEEIESEKLIRLIHDQEKSALIIFNSKKDALHFYQEINANQVDKKYHLSTSMCPLHRKSILEDIKNDLNSGKRILTVSTQLVEAGVDFDFPVVFRALAPLDSIIQAAGRCNREGKLKDQNGQSMNGQVYVFRLKKMGMPFDKTYITATDYTAIFIKDKIKELMSPEIYADYYSSLLSMFINQDRASIDDSRGNLEFQKVADRYKIIDSPATPVFIKDYNTDSKQIYQNIRYKPYLSQRDHRRLQAFTVQLYPSLVKSAAGFIQELDNGALIWDGGYSEETGIIVELENSDFIL